MGQVVHGKNLLKFELLILSEEKLEELILSEEKLEELILIEEKLETLVEEKLKLIQLEALLIGDRLESSLVVVRFTGWRMSLSREKFFKLSGRGKDFSEQEEVLTGQA